MLHVSILRFPLICKLNILCMQLIYMKTIFYPCNLLLSSIQYSERRAGNEHSSIILSTVSFFNIKIVTKILKINHSWSTSVSGKILVKKSEYAILSKQLFFLLISLTLTVLSGSFHMRTT